MNLLGAFQLTSSDGQIIALRGKKKQGLLAYPALSRDCTASRNQASSVLWSQRDSEKQANPGLKTALSELRKVFSSAGYENVLTTIRISISLNLDHILVGTFELRRLAKSKIMSESLDRS